MDQKELIIDQESLPIASAVVRSLDVLAEFYSQTTGPIRWSAVFKEEKGNRFLNTYNLYRQSEGGDRVIQLTLTESVIVDPIDGGLREIVCDLPPKRSEIDAFPNDCQTDSAFDTFCSFLAQHADLLFDTLVKPYLASKAIELEDGQQGIVRDSGTLKFLLLTNEDQSQIEEIRLYGIDMSSIERGDAIESAVDRSWAFDGHQDFLSIRPPVDSGPEARLVAGVAVESQSITEEIDADGLEEPESDEALRGLEADLEAVGSRFDALATFEESDFVPPYFMTSRKVLSQADPVPSPDILESAGGRVCDVQHPDNANACLRIISLPRNLKATKSAATLLAGSGAIQSGDVLLSFRPQWSRTNAYGNIQLGLSHAALALIDTRGSRPIVHTLENPIKYSSHLSYSGHYGDLDYFHIVRPALSAAQKSNLRKWAFLILTRSRGQISFFGNYGSPYFSRESNQKNPISVSQKLARIVTTGSGSLATYCSELVWALLGLRDCDPADYDPGRGLEKPIFDPLTGAEESLLLDPGLVQGPDITLRQSGLADNIRRDLMTGRVLVDVVSNPSQLQGIMSSGHREAARLNQPKVNQLKAFHTMGEPGDWLGKPWNDDSDPSTNLNFGVIPNYSPTSFFILANSDSVDDAGQKVMRYIGTVAFGKT